jgi:hypothetical protein
MSRFGLCASMRYERWMRGTLLSRRWRCPGSRSLGEELAFVSRDQAQNAVATLLSFTQI